jgi:hypothetical protein
MAYRYIHHCERWDVGREEIFFLYRFPFDRQVVEKIKNSIPKRYRYFTQKTKAWHVHKDWVEVIENILEEAFPGLPFCPSCQKKGDQCSAWSHIRNCNGWRRVKAEEGSTKSSEQKFYESGEQQYYHDVEDEFRYNNENDPFRFHRETHQQRQNAQNAYDEWARNRYQNFHKRPDQPQEQPKDRWVDPGPRRRDSKWAMAVLGISVLPNSKDLKKLFRHLAMKYHPDHGGDGSKMALINAAREYLEAYIR